MRKGGDVQSREMSLGTCNKGEEDEVEKTFSLQFSWLGITFLQEEEKEEKRDGPWIICFELVELSLFARRAPLVFLFLAEGLIN